MGREGLRQYGPSLPDTWAPSQPRQFSARKPAAHLAQPAQSLTFPKESARLPITPPHRSRLPQPIGSRVQATPQIRRPLSTLNPNAQGNHPRMSGSGVKIGRQQGFLLIATTRLGSRVRTSLFSVEGEAPLPCPLESSAMNWLADTFGTNRRRNELARRSFPRAAAAEL